MKHILINEIAYYFVLHYPPQSPSLEQFFCLNIFQQSRVGLLI